MLITSKHGKDILTHDEEKHFYLLNGKELDGVTTIISQGYPKSQRIYDWQIREGAKWAIEEYISKVGDDGICLEKDEIIKQSPEAYKKSLEDAGDIGTIVHDYCYHVEKGLKFTLDPKHPEAEKIWRCCQSFDEYRVKNNDVILKLEELVCSPKYKYAGRFDRLVKRNEIVTLVDYKTSSGFYITQFLQLAAYSMAIKEWFNIEVKDLEIVRFDKESGKLSTRNLQQVANTVELKPQTVMKKLQNQFISTLETYRFKNKFDRYIRK